MVSRAFVLRHSSTSSWTRRTLSIVQLPMFPTKNNLTTFKFKWAKWSAVQGQAASLLNICFETTLTGFFSPRDCWVCSVSGRWEVRNLGQPNIQQSATVCCFISSFTHSSFSDLLKIWLHWKCLVWYVLYTLKLDKIWYHCEWLFRYVLYTLQHGRSPNVVSSIS